MYLVWIVRDLQDYIELMLIVTQKIRHTAVGIWKKA